MPDMENPGSVGTDTGAMTRNAGSGFVRSEATSRSAPMPGVACGWAGIEVITNAGAGPTTCCWAVACPVAVIR